MKNEVEGVRLPITNMRQNLLVSEGSHTHFTVRAVNSLPVSEQHTDPKKLIRAKLRKARTVLSRNKTSVSTLGNLTERAN